MDTQVSIQEQEQTGEGQLIEVAFPLAKQPVDLQLTIHINNLLATYPDRKWIIKTFKEVLYRPDDVDPYLSGLRINQIVNYYGIEKCRQWFNLVYGWEFSPQENVVDDSYEEVII